MIKAQQIYDATNGGLDIIKYFYPQVREDNKAFKIRDEATPSARLKCFNGIWMVTDFGDVVDANRNGGQALNAINVTMKEMNIEFREAISYLAAQYGISDDSIIETNGPVFFVRDPEGEEKEGAFLYKTKELSIYELEVLGPKVDAETCERYNYKSVEWYSRTKLNKEGKLKTTVIRSTDKYPIYMRECGTFRKFYSPLSFNKAYRFFYQGEKPAVYINGFDELKAAYTKLNKESSDLDSKEDNKENQTKSGKYPAAVICSGERDALCCAARGMMPLWFNSESYNLSWSEHKKIMHYVDKLYYIPDLDDTGRKMGIAFGLKFIDTFLVWLPEKLTTYRDSRGKPRKDLRDFCEAMDSSIEGFKRKTALAMPLKFWEESYENTKQPITINSEYLLHFLKCNNFGVYTNKIGHNIIRLENNTAKSYTNREVRTFIRNFLKEKEIPIKIINMTNTTTKTNAQTIDLLTDVEPDFNKSTYNSQYFFFKDAVVEVTADDIKKHRLGGINKYVWKDDVVQHGFKRIDKAFNITKENDKYNIDITNKKSHFFRYLIQTSRMFWREELETRLDNLSKEEREAYLAEHKFSIDGPLLTADEIAEQKESLINKIFAIGYLLSRHKAADRAWCVFAMDARLSSNMDSNGRSGKSFFFKALSNIIKQIGLSGKTQRFDGSSPHLWDRVTEQTDIVLIDDTTPNFKLEHLFDIITGNWIVNPKGKDSFGIPFERSPKLAISSNFALKNPDGSTLGRLLYVLFSDYYHENGKNQTDYRETRKISSDFENRTLMDEQYKDEYWNEDFNIMMDCLQFYLSTTKENIKLQPNMQAVLKRTAQVSIPDEFVEWAEIYFDPEEGELDKLFMRKDAKESYIAAANPKFLSSQRFKTLLMTYCEFMDYELNPKSVWPSGRIMMRPPSMGGVSKPEEHFYIKSKDKDVDPAVICNTKSAKELKEQDGKLF